MKNEEIEAIGMLEGDRIRMTMDTVVGSRRAGFVEIRCGAAKFEVQNADIIAIERVMPELPDGWAWDPCDQYQASYGDKVARVNLDGSIIGSRLGVGCNPDQPWPIPALVARALLEAWERKAAS